MINICVHRFPKPLRTFAAAVAILIMIDRWSHWQFTDNHRVMQVSQSSQRCGCFHYKVRCHSELCSCFKTINEIPNYLRI